MKGAAQETRKKGAAAPGRVHEPWFAAAFRRRWPAPGHGHPLFLVAWFFWGLPVLWRVGNWISDLRLTLYVRYGWEWI